jgi:hypothetical protein
MARDWASYNRKLEQRGSITLFLDEEVIDGWLSWERTGMRGAPALYSQAAYRACYSFQMLYGLPLRQTHGFVSSLLTLLDTGLEAPSVASLSERRAFVEIEPITWNPALPLTLILDSTGFKTGGDGEWLSDKHRRGAKRRRYRKLHVGIDHETGQIVAFKVTDSSVSDIEAMDELVAQATERRDLAELIADGAYDAKETYELGCDYHGAKVTVRLPKNARVGLHPRRDNSFRLCGVLGKKDWGKALGYGRRSRVETTMSQLKGIADSLSTRSEASQEAELRLLIDTVNRWSQ